MKKLILLLTLTITLFNVNAQQQDTLNCDKELEQLYDLQCKIANVLQTNYQKIVIDTLADDEIYRFRSLGIVEYRGILYGDIGHQIPEKYIKRLKNNTINTMSFIQNKYDWIDIYAKGCQRWYKTEYQKLRRNGH